MRIRHTDNGVDLRLVRVIYDKERKLQKKDPKREEAIGRIRAACGPEDIDTEIRLNPGYVLNAKERNQLLTKLEPNRRIHKDTRTAALRSAHELLAKAVDPEGDGTRTALSRLQAAAHAFSTGLRNAINWVRTRCPW